jgi:uroporphyrinogen III methyltransferase/synthase
MTRTRKIVGRITFVGAGPGDPGLLTTQAAAVLSSAELVVADSTVPAAIVAVAEGEVRPSEANPAETAKVLLAEARAGRVVVRLVPGDPLTDEAVVKEALAVAKTVVPFDIVPGVALGAGTAAYAGVPVGAIRTEADLTAPAAADYEALANAAGTLVLTVDAADAAYVG